MKKKPCEKMLEALRILAEDLENGVPIEATEVRKIDTPDGPMHVSRPIVLNTEEKEND